MLRCSPIRLLIPVITVITFGIAGCGGGNFESSGDPYGGISGGQDEVEDVEADLLRQKQAAGGG